MSKSKEDYVVVLDEQYSDFNGRNYTPFGIAKGKAVIKALKPKLCIVFVSKRILLINLKHEQYDS